MFQSVQVFQTHRSRNRHEITVSSNTIEEKKREQYLSSTSCCLGSKELVHLSPPQTLSSLNQSWPFSDLPLSLPLKSCDAYEALCHMFGSC